MDEKLDFKSKYEKLRKKYVQLKQQAVTLKEQLETKESEFEHLKISFEDLENKHRECIASLDASQYKETQLQREMQELVCQLEQFKLHGNIKVDQQAGQNTKTGQGILTGLLPMNGVIMSFQKNEKLEEKVAVLQEELDLKILENEQLHIKEFDLKRQHQKVLEENIANNAKLKSEIENLNKEIDQLKLNKGNDGDIVDELKRLQDKDRINNQKISEILENNRLNEKNLNNKIDEIRNLVPNVNFLQLEEEYSTWVSISRQKNSFIFLKLESLISEFLTNIAFFVDSWSKYIDYYLKNTCFKDKVIERIYQKIQALLEEGNKILMDSPAVFQSEIILEHNFAETAYNYGLSDQDQINKLEIKELLIERPKNAMRSIQSALNLQIIVFKMEFRKLSESKSSFEFQSEIKALQKLFTVVKNLKNFLPKSNCLLNFVINLGKEPDLIYTHTLWTNSFHIAFLELRREIINHFDRFCPEIEDRKQFFDFLRKIFIEDVTFKDENISLSDSFISSHNKLIELESIRKVLHSKMTLKIKNNMNLISNELKGAYQIFESTFFSENASHPFFTEMSKDVKNSIINSLLEMSRFLDENQENFGTLVSLLYQHPSIICQGSNNFSELQISMRETKSKLEAAPPKITLPELHILNKRIEQLEESKSEQLKTISNLMNQLKFATETPNLNNHESDLNHDLSSVEVFPDHSNSETCTISELNKSKIVNQPQKYIHEVFESQLREANETLENTVTRLQLRIDDLNDDIQVTRQSYDEQISLLSQHICSLSERLAQTDASTLSSFNQEILCYSCENWSTLDLILTKTRGACKKCKTKLLRQK